MTPRRSESGYHGGHRDAALWRVRRTTRWVTAGATTAVVALVALAAYDTPGHATVAPPAANGAGSTAGSGGSGSGSPASGNTGSGAPSTGSVGSANVGSGNASLGDNGATFSPPISSPIQTQQTPQAATGLS